MELPIAGVSYKHESQDANYQRYVNCYTTDPGPNGRGAGVVRPTMGLLSLHDTEAQACRGIWKVFDYVYAVFDENLYKIEINFITKSIDSVTDVGTLSTSAGAVRLAYDLYQIMIVDNTSTGYVYLLQNRGRVNPGPIGGTGGDTYTLTINGVAVYTNQNVASALTDSALVTQINTKTGDTGVTAVLDAGVITLSMEDDSTITITESGTGFTAGTDGLTLSSGVFASGSLAPFRAIADADFLGGSDVVFSQGYFIYSQNDTADMQSSALNDAEDWDAADVASAEARPDKIKALAVNKGELWALGEDTIEIWENTAEPTGFPFTFKQGCAIDIGLMSRDSLAYIDNSLIFLDNRGYVVQSATSEYIVNTSSTYQLNILSTNAMHAEFSTYSNLTSAIGFQFNDRGKLMYQINFPDDNKTWVCDVLLGKDGWHERNYHNPDTNRYDSHLAEFCCDYNGMLLVANQREGKIYHMSHDFYDDNGIPIESERTFGPFNQESELTEVSEIVLRCQTGTNPPSGDGSLIYITLQFSNDGGHTWSREIPRNMGSAGDYAKPIVWRPLGTGREWLFRFKVVAPVNWAIISGSVK